MSATVTYRTCPSCKSVWPAATTIEAFNNHRRVNKIHPGVRCEDIKASNEPANGSERN